MADNISNNPSYQRLREQMKQAEDFRMVLRLLDPTREKFPDLHAALDQVPEFQQQLESLARLPDELNHYYGNKGWIAYESMESSVLTLAVELAKQGNIEQDEIELLKYYQPENLKFRINFIRGVKEFAPRLRLIELSMEDYSAGRYHANPSFLMMIDGVVNDVTKDLGIFAENVDLSAWDSIAAHDSGLGQLSRLLSKTRKRTNEDPIAIPLGRRYMG